MIGLSVIVSLMFIIAAMTDVRSFIIPNWISVGIVLSYCVRWLIAGQTTDLLPDSALAAVMLVMGFGLYAMNWFGAGDIKLMAAGVLWSGHTFALDFLFFTAVLGGIVGLVVLGLRSLDIFLPILPGLHRIIPRVNLVPYGVAIAGAGLITISLQTGLIAMGAQRSSWGLF